MVVIFNQKHLMFCLQNFCRVSFSCNTIKFTQIIKVPWQFTCRVDNLPTIKTERNTKYCIISESELKCYILLIHLPACFLLHMEEIKKQQRRNNLFILLVFTRRIVTTWNVIQIIINIYENPLNIFATMLPLYCWSPPDSSSSSHLTAETSRVFGEKPGPRNMWGKIRG